uniref:Uncharacterized protein n=1 Tax=Arcella intermedia TaxID=1963864 RepID=A0A6B2LKK2_9EUKA
MVVVGSGNVGKTSLLWTFRKGHFPEDVSSWFDPYFCPITLENKTFDFAPWDTNGSEDYDRLRPLSYPDTAIFLVLFSVVSQSSFDEISSKWIPEISHYSPGTPFILVGTKTDLRENAETLSSLSKKGLHPIDTSQGQDLAHKIKAIKYFEISALKNPKGVKDLFHTAILSSSSQKHLKGGCLLL